MKFIGKFIFIWFILFGCKSSNEKIIESWENGNPKKVKVFLNPADTFRFILIYYYPNGNKKEILPIDNEVSNGWKTVFYENGKVKDSIFLKDNKPLSISKHFHNNGVLASTGSYNDSGLREGFWDFYDNIGVHSKSVEYNNGELNGETKFFNSKGLMIKKITRYENGQIKENISYKDSIVLGDVKYFEHGEYSLRDYDGDLKLSGVYNNGRKTGNWVYYNSEGKRLKEYFLVNGRKEKLINCWNLDGELTLFDGNGYFEYYSYCSDGEIAAINKEFYQNSKKTRSQREVIKKCL